VAAALLLRSGRLGALVGLVAGGLVGALVAWRVGLLLSPPEIAAAAKEVRVGDTFEGPLRMSAYGVLLAWPTAAVITFFAVVAGLDVESHGTDRAEPLPERAESADHAGLTATDPVTGVTATDPGAAEPSRLSPGVPPEPPAPR
jgi:hypothetical protein